MSTKKNVEEWIWVDGYKGTNANMQCYGYQYELGKRHDMPEDAKIELCESGFHFCTNLNDVFGYYNLGAGNRFFKVRALVRKKDFDEHNKPRGRFDYFDRLSGLTITSSGAIMFGGDKLVSKSIEFLSECTMDEIFQCPKWEERTKDFTDEEKKEALSTSIKDIEQRHKEEKKKAIIAQLVELGYSAAFAGYIVSEGKTDIAIIVGSQPDLSMDMKALMIMLHGRDD